MYAPLRKISFSLILAIATFSAVESMAVAAMEPADVSLVRLSSDQYVRTIRDVFGPGVKVRENKVAPGIRDEGLLAIGMRKMTVGSASLEQYEETARDIARQVFDARRRATLVGCSPKSEAAPDVKCATSFVQRVGLHLFRRPLTDAEVSGYVAMHDSVARSRKSFYDGMQSALVGLLIAPDLLFRVENTVVDPSNPNVLRLDAWSMASRLSFFLWDSPPDAELLAAAGSGALLTPQGLNAQVDRLLMSPRIAEGTRAFFSDTLGFDGFATHAVDTTLYPKFTKHVSEDAGEQTMRTIVDHLLVKNRPYGDLFVTRDTFLTPALAAVYGVPLPRSQELGGAVPWVPYQFPEGDPRVGILTQASFLSLNSHPGTTSITLRGKALREKLLCQKVPPPPGNIDFSLVTNVHNDQLRTARKRLNAHSADAMCAGCHKITDPIGFALENFDTASAFRTHEQGDSIDTSGNLDGKPFSNIKELAQLLRVSPAANSCIVNRAYAFGVQRRPEKTEREWLTKTYAEFTQSGGVHWRVLLRKIATNPDFYVTRFTARPATQVARAGVISGQSEQGGN